MIEASSGPSPKTVCVAGFQSGHARQRFDARRSASTPLFGAGAARFVILVAMPSPSNPCATRM
jgi:hypothetical protein